MTSHWRQSIVFFFRAVKALACESRRGLFTAICTLYLLPNEHWAIWSGNNQKKKKRLSHMNEVLIFLLTFIWKFVCKIMIRRGWTNFFLDDLNVIQRLTCSLPTQSVRQTYPVKLIHSEISKSLEFGAPMIGIIFITMHLSAFFFLFSPLLRPASLIWSIKMSFLAIMTFTLSHKFVNLPPRKGQAIKKRFCFRGAPLNNSLVEKKKKKERKYDATHFV